MYKTGVPLFVHELTIYIVLFSHNEFGYSMCTESGYMKLVVASGRSDWFGC